MSTELQGDERLTKELSEAILSDTHLIGSDIAIKVRNNQLILKGVVPHFWQKIYLLSLAQHFREISEIQEAIEVEPTRKLEDNELADKAEEALSENAWFEGKDLEAEAFDGMLILRGTVGSLAEKALAERCLFGLPGLIDIQNRLSVIPRIKKNDLEIAEELRKSLEEEGIPLDTIGLNVLNRTLVLTGSVTCLFMKIRIGRIAEMSRALKSVHNKIEVLQEPDLA